MIKLLTGDALATLQTLPAQSVHMVCTSPPYWGLRDYEVDGQIGNEPTIAEYLATLVGVFAEVWRVLRDDGTLWLNLGDKYNSGASGGLGGSTLQGGQDNQARSNRSSFRRDRRPREAESAYEPSLKPKDLCGLPWRLAFALQDAGWYLRSDIIWHKPNPMPESAADRPTKSHEYLFLLTKRPRYFYDQEAVRRPHAKTTLDAFSGGKGSKYAAYGKKTSQDASGNVASGAFAKGDKGHGRHVDPRGANLRTVWTIPTMPSVLPHFAMYPPALVEPCIKAGSSEKGCCATCGAGWTRVVEKHRTHNGERDNNIGAWRNTDKASPTSAQGDGHQRYGSESHTLGWRPQCTHGGLPVPCTVLDPFSGTGTTGLVANRLGRHYIGIEANADSNRMAFDRITTDPPTLASSIAQTEITTQGNPLPVAFDQLALFPSAC